MPYHFGFGTTEMKYFRLPASADAGERRSSFAKELDDELASLLRKTATEWSQERRMAKSGASLDPAKQNHYPPGTLVLLDKYQGGFNSPS